MTAIGPNTGNTIMEDDITTLQTLETKLVEVITRQSAQLEGVRMSIALLQQKAAKAAADEAAQAAALKAGTETNAPVDPQAANDVAKPVTIPTDAAITAAHDDLAAAKQPALSVTS